MLRSKSCNFTASSSNMYPELWRGLFKPLRQIPCNKLKLKKQGFQHCPRESTTQHVQICMKTMFNIIVQNTTFRYLLGQTTVYRVYTVYCINHCRALDKKCWLSMHILMHFPYYFLNILYDIIPVVETCYATFDTAFVLLVEQFSHCFSHWNGYLS